MSLTVSVAKTSPPDATAIGYPVGTNGPVPRALGLTRAALTAAGFDGKPGQVVVNHGVTPVAIAVGIGEPERLDAATLRTAAGALVRAASPWPSVATTLANLDGVPSAAAGAAVAEGAHLAAYRFDRYKSAPKVATLQSVSLVAAPARYAGVTAGVERGTVTAGATVMARDLANTPGSDMSAAQLADWAATVATGTGLGIQVFNRDQLQAMGCGGIIGVNRGSTAPPRLVKLTYTPPRPKAHLALVGKGVTFDSGGLSLKTSDGMISMKLDMSGAAAVLAAMSTLAELGCPNRVTGFMACTDNMPSGSALKLGDVLRFRNGKTAEIHNTDAEGRLILADALSLAAEERPDAIVDVATLTGACVVALGQQVAGVIGNDEALIGQVRAAAVATDEPVWPMPLEARYRKLLDSNIADMKNVGGPNGGVITSSLFLSEFVGTTPWAHLDIAGPMNDDADAAWHAKGASGFGARLLAELACTFKKRR